MPSEQPRDKILILLNSFSYNHVFNMRDLCFKKLIYLWHSMNHYGYGDASWSDSSGSYALQGQQPAVAQQAPAAAAQPLNFATNASAQNAGKNFKSHLASKLPFQVILWSVMN